MNIEGATPNPERPDDGARNPYSDNPVPRLHVSRSWEEAPTGPDNPSAHRPYRIIRPSNPEASAPPAEHSNSEHVPVAYTAPREHVSDDSAQDAARHLRRQGSLEQVAPGDITDKTLTANDLVKSYLKQTRVPGDGAEIVVADYQKYIAAQAGSLEEVKAMVNDYDHFFPTETPQERLARKQALLSRWDSVQVLRGHAASNEALALEVSGPECAVPEGFDLTDIYALPLSVAYPTTFDAIEAVGHYEASRALSESGPLPVAPQYGLESLEVGNWRVAPYNYPPQTVVTTDEHHKDELGVAPIERFAYAEEKPVNYATEFSLTFQAPMPDDLLRKREQARTQIPLVRFAQMIGAVMGQEFIISGVPADTSWKGAVAFEGPGGRIQFGGNIAKDGTIGVRRERFSKHHANSFRRPAFNVVVDLNGRIVTPDETRIAAQRLAAWMNQAAGLDKG
jgi:hypothetical protein